MARQIQPIVQFHIQDRGYTVQEVAEKIGTLPSAVEAVYRRDNWPLETVLHFVERLGIDVRLSVWEGTTYRP